MKKIEVVAAIIVKNNSIFITQRGYGEFKGKWEFPGGKIEQSETRKQALTREIKEELDAEICIKDFLCTVEYDYKSFYLTMHCYICTLKNEYYNLKEHKNAKFVTIAEINDINFLKADLLAISRLKNYISMLNSSNK